MQVKLKVMAGSHTGTEISVSTDKFVIGRSETCNLRPKSESVSRKHCIMVLRDNKVLVQDLKSRNGTFVNEKRLPPDKAKVLVGGDKLRVGKLEFEVVIEHGLQAPKRPEVKDMGEAAARTVAAAADGSRFEAIDVNSWLDEADQIDRVRKLSDPDTRQFRFDTVDKSLEGDSGELSGDDSKLDKAAKPKKAAPGKLPTAAKAITDDSRQAADDALKKFFSGR